MLERMVNTYLAHRPSLESCERPTHHSVEHTDDPGLHLRLSAKALHPTDTAIPLEGSLLFAVHHCAEHRYDMARIRSMVLCDLADLCEDLREECDIWHQQLPHHIQQAYRSLHADVDYVRTPVSWNTQV